MTREPKPPRADAVVPVGIVAIFLAFLRLGLTSFGGPVAHIGYFREAFVRRLGWLDEARFADLLALSQFLPGPSSSQLGIGIGYTKRGLAGALAAFVGFTLPSALVMGLLGAGLASSELAKPGVLAGLAIVAVAVVAEAVRGMATSLAATRNTALVAIIAAAIALAFPSAFTQIAIIAAAALLGAFVPLQPIASGKEAVDSGSRHAGIAALALFVLLIAGLPLVALVTRDPLALFTAAFVKAGALVFGGGHVVLPLLERSVVAGGFVSGPSFIAGYGAAQAMPGPLFSIAAFLGAAAALPNAAVGALIATLALFAPGFLLMVGILPFWRELGAIAAVRRALVGVNAAVVGILAAALYDPVFLTAVHGPRDAALALLAFGAITVLRLPAWLVVVAALAVGLAIAS